MRSMADRSQSGRRKSIRVILRAGEPGIQSNGRRRTGGTGAMAIPKEIIRVSDAVWEIPRTYKEGMRVPGRIVATEKLLADFDDGAIDQLTNVAMLPGIVGYAYCMPDGHWGYGFPIGGLAAMGAVPGVISPGGIGFDVNCGMRLC